MKRKKELRANYFEHYSDVLAEFEKKAWQTDEDFDYVITMTDVHEILSKYFS